LAKLCLTCKPFFFGRRVHPAVFIRERMPFCAEYAKSIVLSQNSEWENIVHPFATAA
jgi:hypothetical protein